MLMLRNKADHMRAVTAAHRDRMYRTRDREVVSGMAHQYDRLRHQIAEVDPPPGYVAMRDAMDLIRQAAAESDSPAVAYDLEEAVLPRLGKALDLVTF